jgi:dihydrofolate synthase/folylpolyglutamate synthase
MINSPSSLDELWGELNSRWPESRIAPSLARIASVMELMGDPQRSYPVITIAGTNGKSSTARMVDSLLRSFGLRTGLYTSPHLVDPRERICLEGEPIEAGRLLDAWRDIAPYVAIVDQNSTADGGTTLSYFEVMTALAYAAFADAPVDVAVIEVGMGGSWDATNVADAAVAVITPIGLDHTEYLGDTLTEIAGEKAGVIKAGATVVVGQQDLAAAEVILLRCAEQDAAVAREGLEFAVTERAVAVGGQLLSLRGIRGSYPDVFLPLFGIHQAHNASLALAAVESFLGGDSALDADAVREGFATTVSPGRLQIVRTGPTVLVDAAHNPHGAASLAAAIEDSFQFTSVLAVIGMLADKDAAGFLEVIQTVVHEVVITEPQSPRAMPAAELAALAAEILGDDRVTLAPDFAGALDLAMARADEVGNDGGAGIIITGSVVLVGDALRALGKA